MNLRVLFYRNRNDAVLTELRGEILFYFFFQVFAQQIRESRVHVCYTTKVAHNDRVSRGPDRRVLETSGTTPPRIAEHNPLVIINAATF